MVLAMLGEVSFRELVGGSPRLRSWEMPTILRIGGARFFFFSNEGAEPPHIHVEVGDAVAKFWLEPISLASSSRFRAHELARLEKQVVQNRQRFLEAWRDYFRT